MRRLLTIAILVTAPVAAAEDVHVDGQYGYFLEGTGGERGSQVVVQMPSVAATVQPVTGLEVGAGWRADIVTGATEEIADVVTGATRFEDTRHAVSGRVLYEHERTRVGAEGTWGAENDYRTREIALTAEADLAERNTTFSLGYAHNWDQVCNRPNPEETDPSQRQWLDSSEGCFTNAQNRTTDEVALDVLAVGWDQAWTPVLATRLVLESQLVDGFQSNPYRAVALAGAIAQEHVPNERLRLALTLRTHYFVRPLHGALRLLLRGYRDTWDVQSATGEIEYEQYLGSIVRVRARGRYYRQLGALFYSDDYRLEPRGEFFTGDRELSPFQSFLVGGRLAFHVSADADGPLLGFIEDLEVMAKLDLIFYDYSDFTLAGRRVRDNRAVVSTVGLSVGM